MANEVTINIESSLAAMAFVVADQQEQIKTLREINKKWEEMYDNERNANKGHEAAIALLHETIEANKEEIQIYKNKVDSLQQIYEATSESNIELCEHNIELNDKILQWHEIDDYVDSLNNYTLPLSVEDYPHQPFVILKIENIKEGCYDNNNNPIPVGTQNITYAYLNIMDGKYVFDYRDTYTKVVAWCMLCDKNF